MHDTIDPAVGFVISAKPGDHVEKGEPLAAIHARDERGVTVGEKALSEAIFIADAPVQALDLISHRVTATSRDRWKPPAE
jgi:pyrimidine-nucleoside phosphorylase